MIPLKAEVVRSGHYRILSIPFGGPIKGKDLDAQYFSGRTDTKPDWFQERPMLFHHGLDPHLGVDLVGKAEGLNRESDGWWSDAWMNKQHRYFAMIDDMVQKGKMFGSSGTMPHLIKASRDGELLVWPHIEQTLSPLPRNPYSVVRATKALGDFEEAGLDTQALEALLNDLSSDLREQTSAMQGDVAAKALNASLAELEDIVRRIGG